MIFRTCTFLVWSFALMCRICEGADQVDAERKLAEQSLVNEYAHAEDVQTRFLAGRALIRLDYWKYVNDHQSAAFRDVSPDRIEHLLFEAWRWHFDRSKQDPVIDQLIAHLESQGESSQWARVVFEMIELNVDVTAESTAGQVSQAGRDRWAKELRESADRVDPETGWKRSLALGLLVVAEADPAQRLEYESQLVGLLQSPEYETRTYAALVLARLDQVESETWVSMSAIAEAFQSTGNDVLEADVSGAEDLLLIAIARHARANGSSESVEQSRAILRNMIESRHAATVMAFEALAEIGEAEDLSWMIPLLNSPDTATEHRVAASYASLRIQRRQVRQLGLVDWLVIAAYAMAMIGIGIYYAMRTRNSEDYLLGGRRMRPSVVGLSMFASLLSTLTYLAQPGEVIRNGPMTLVQVISFPFVFVVVGWLLIPYLMRNRVVSGYEILETKLGVSSRLLGSTIFLILRVLWMATIIYVTTSTVLIPMLGWSGDAVPLVCVAIGIITLIYTSLGGLRAVVMTDAIQTAILFGGAVLAITMITIEMGGLAAWFPRSYFEHWQEPVVLDPSVRTSFAGLFLAMFTWQVCTYGSDQMAIQRFLATENVRSARKVLLFSLGTNGVVMVFLVVLGLALLSYIQSHPWIIPDDKSLFVDSDKMLPSFVVRRLPMGIAGLVIAGLLAAAMSSLSSGVNSSCSVITTDFVNRFRRKKLDDRAQIRMAKWISAAVGALVVGLSLYVSIVPGNVFELCFKIVNLLVGPLFLLFFLAFFIPMANNVGAWAGVLSGSASAILIGFWDQLFASDPPMSFVWLTPVSFGVGAVVALAASVTSRAMFGRSNRDSSSP